MPTYVYAVIQPDGTDGETFEVVQPMREDALTTHPEDGRPVRRIITAPHVVTEHSTASDNRKQSDSNLERLGFTKYHKGSNGYEKAFGAGPDLSQIKKHGGL
jgi:predicted nucleic acid-binding Zn ribbon protein